jgi:hypothetical protein
VGHGRPQEFANNNILERKMTTTAPNLIRWTGLAAILAGIVFAGIQPIHPPDELASVTTPTWAIITPLKTTMALLFLVGLTGLYARQVNEAGWLGLAGYVLFSLSWAFNFAFIFTEAFVMPPLASVAPQFVAAFMTIASGQQAGDVNIGSLPTLYAVFCGGGYMLGGLLFGIATFRAGVLPRWAAALLALTAALTPAAALLPHAIQRLAGVPMGLVIAWLGYALLSERRESAVESQTGRGGRTASLQSVRSRQMSDSSSSREEEAA